MNAVPAAALDLIRRFEGCELSPYHDPIGFPTQGYGRLLSRQKGADLSAWRPIDESTAESWLATDAAKAGQTVRRLITAPLTDGQYAALIDFVFNLGGGHLELSTLRRVINRGDVEDAPQQFSKWVYAGGIKLAGLVRRRAAEVALWTAA